MITAQSPIVSPAVTVEQSHLGAVVRLGDIQIATIDCFPVWGLTTGVSFALAQGMSLEDEVWVYNHIPYRYLASAVAAANGDYLTRSSTIDTLPDYN
jgi:hypothetical protein